MFLIPLCAGSLYINASQRVIPSVLQQFTSNLGFQFFFFAVMTYFVEFSFMLMGWVE